MPSYSSAVWAGICLLAMNGAELLNWLAVLFNAPHKDMKSCDYVRVR